MALKRQKQVKAVTQWSINHCPYIHAMDHLNGTEKEDIKQHVQLICIFMSAS